MRNIKYIFLTIMIVIVIGCTKEDLVPNYNKMQVDSDGINGYMLDLRIYGTTEQQSINESVDIKNYNNTEYEIKIANSSPIPLEGNEDEIIYVKDDNVYIKDEADKYIVTTEEINYSDPSIYLEGLKNINKINKPTEEKIGTMTYKVYDVVISKNIVEKIIDNINIDGVNVTDDVSSKIYIDEEGYVYRIIYYIKDLTINANYYGIDKARPINFPDEIMD